MAIIAPFFVGWTIYGVCIFVKLNNEEQVCSAHQNNESYAFLIFWFILSFVLILSYICLVCYGYA